MELWSLYNNMHTPAQGLYNNIISHVLRATYPQSNNAHASCLWAQLPSGMLDAL